MRAGQDHCWICPTKWWCAVFLHQLISRTLDRKTTIVCTKEEILVYPLIPIRMREVQVNSLARSILFTIHWPRMEFSTILSQHKIMKALSANIKLKLETASLIQIILTIRMWVSNQVWGRLWDQNLRKELAEVAQRRKFRQRDQTTLWQWFNQGTFQT